MLYSLQMGNSVVCYIHDFLPYFYIPAPQGFQPHSVPLFIQSLEVLMLTWGPSLTLPYLLFLSYLQHAMRAERQNYEAKFVHDIQLTMKESIYGFHNDNKALFLKVILTQPRHVPFARWILESGIQIGGFTSFATQTYESDIQFVLRFMIDAEVVLLSESFHPINCIVIFSWVDYWNVLGRATPWSIQSSRASNNSLSIGIRCQVRYNLSSDYVFEFLIHSSIQISAHFKPCSWRRMVKSCSSANFKLWYWMCRAWGGFPWSKIRSGDSNR